MKTNLMTILKLLVTAVGIFMLVSPARGQMGNGDNAGNPYDTGVDSPFLRKKKGTPTPSGAAAKSKAQPSKAQTLSEKDNKFLVNAVSSGGWEAKTGAGVESKLQNSAVKSLASRLVADSTKTNTDLIALAKKKGLNISTDNFSGQQVPGPNVDKNYLSLVEQELDKSIPLFQKQASSGDDPEIKAQAAKILPLLRQHSSALKEAQSQLK